ncbi:MAG: hypothetical protein IJ875_05335 [Solobacterium sp.]|nr:hypothetical protein [Solobacterium sp.]
MVVRFLIFLFLLVSFPAKANNGYYQATRIDIEGIDGPCYATLLSDKSVSGKWSATMKRDFDAPEEIENAFLAYQDEHRFSYLQYFQDVSGGYLFWPTFPPEVFKLLIYIPETDTFYVSDKLERYALTSTYKAIVKDGKLLVEKNYDYGKMALITIIRILMSIGIVVLSTYLIGKPHKTDQHVVWITNIIFYLGLQIFISVYSFKDGFSLIEYYYFILPLTIIFLLIQGRIYSRKAKTILSSYLCAFFSNAITYICMLLVLDFIPQLFTIV